MDAERIAFNNVIDHFQSEATWFRDGNADLSKWKANKVADILDEFADDLKIKRDQTVK